MSDNLPAIGVVTAPVTKYAVRIQEDMPYETWKSGITSGMAGINIVSAYIAIVAIELRITSSFQA